MTRLMLLAPAEGSAGGAGQYNRRIVAELRAAGHAADLVDLRGTYPAPIANASDVAAVAALPEDALLVLDGIAWALAPALQRPPIGLIHQPAALHGEYGAAARVALDAAMTDALRGMARLIATSEGVAASLTGEFAVAAERVSVVTPGVDDAPRRGLRASGPCEVLSFGRLVPRRAHEVLLRALAALADLDWRLSLIGSLTADPDHAAWLETVAAETGIRERVRFLPKGTEPDWAASDLVAIAAPVAGLTGLVMQALRRGLPLALGATAFPPCPAEAAAFCPPGDTETLSRALRRMIFDTGLRGRMAEAAWQAGQCLPEWAIQASRFVAICERGGAGA